MNNIKHISGKLRLLLLLLLLAGGETARAQYTVRVTTVTIPPLGSDFDEMLGAGIGGHFMVMLSAATATAGTPYVKIAGTLECLSPTPFSITLNSNFRPGGPIIVAGTAPTTLTPGQLGEAFGNFIQNNMVAQGLSLTSLLNAGGGLHYQLPEGTYRLCITAYAFDATGYTKPISDPNSGCTTFTICYKASAPQFVLPINTMAIPTEIPLVNPSYPVQFTWTAPNSTCGAVISPLTYTLEMHQIFPGQSPLDALNNPPVFTKGGIPSVVFPFDTLLYPNILQQGKQYAVRVRASANANAFANVSNVIFANNGFSTVGAFQYGRTFQVPAPGMVLVPGVDQTPSNPPPNTGTSPANCGLTPPGNTTPLTPGTSLAGATLTIGGFMLTPDASIQQSSDGSWSGTGTISWKPFGNPINLAVSFNHIGINADKQVYSGTIGATMDPGQFSNQNYSQWTSYTSQSGAQLDQLAVNVQNYLQSGAHLASQISGNAPVYLPLGLDKQSIAGQQATLAIMSMSFSPQGATMNVLFNVAIPEANGALTLAGMNFCLSPTGTNFSQGTLALPENRTFNIGNGLSLTFKGCPNSTDSLNGTYVSWGNGQLKDIVAHAQISLPSSAIVPDNNGTPGSGPVIANAVWQFSSWDDWIASVSLPAFEITGVQGIGIQAPTVYYDHSTNQNAPGFAFPPNYQNANGNAWEGLYVPGMQVLLPSTFRSFNQGSQRTSFAAQNLILDEDGVSADLKGSHIIDISTGDLGGWSFSLDQLEVVVVQNTFQSGNFSGGLRLPLSSSSTLAYTGDLHAGNGPLQYSFLVQPSGAITFDIWAAQVTLTPTSNISVSQDAQGTKVSATLNGSVNIVLSSGKPNLNFTALNFEGLGLSNRNTQGQQGFQFNEGTWTWGCSTFLAGFPVTINNVQPSVTTSGTNINLGINFDVNVNIGVGDASVVSGTTNLTVFGTLNPGNISSPPKILTGGGVQVDSVYINGGVGPLNLQGYLAIYNHSNTYGDGFKGHVVADFQVVTVQATVQFGNVNNYNYWFVDACVNFPVIPIVPSPFGFSGFGGGAYYNMKMGTNLPSDPTNLHAAHDPDDNNAGSTVSGVTYTPSQGSAGIMATMCFATVGTNDGMNASLTLTGQMTNGAFSGINLNGNMYALTNYPSNSDAIISGTVDIQIDFANPTFSLSADLKGNWVTTFDVPLGMYVGSNGWYFKMGDPFGQRVSVQFIKHQDPVTQFSAQASAYFEMGSLISAQLPPPQMSGITIGSEAQAALNSIIGQQVTKGLSVSLGMMFGADVTASFQFTFACIYASVTGGVGFDLEIANYSGSSCGGSIGWNNWYATGQFYAYLTLDVGISVDVWFAHGNFSLVTFSLACDFQAGAPNPTWVTGSVQVSGSIFNGWISFNQSVSVSIGQQCYGTPPDPLKDAKIISGYGPSGNADVFVYPYVTTNLSLDQPITLNIPPSQGSPNGGTVTYQFNIASYTIRGGGQTVAVTPDYENNETTVIFKHADMLQPNTTYTVTVVCTVQQLFPFNGSASAGTWGTPLNAQGQPENENETTSFTFTTGPAPTTIVAKNVSNTYPVNGQRYVLKNELSGAGMLQLDEWQDNVFTLPQPTNYSGNTSVENDLYFIDFQDRDTVRGSFTINKGTRQVNFTLPPGLKNQTTYRLEFWVQRVGPAVRGRTMGSYSGSFSGASAPVEKVDSSTRTVGIGANRLALKFANKTVSGGNYEAAAPLPSNEIYTLYFRTSEYNTFADKINTWGNWSGSRNGLNINIQTGQVRGEPFDGIELKGYKGPDGTSWPPLFQAGIGWDHSDQNDRYADDQLYANAISLALPYRVSIDYGVPAVRGGNGLLVAQPVHSLDWSGFYADPSLSSGEMPPVGQPSNTAAGTAAGAFGAVGTRMATNAGNFTSASGGTIFSLPATVSMSLGSSGSGSGGGSSGPGSLNLPTLRLGNSKGGKAETYTLVWSRDYYLHEDWELLEAAGLVGIIEQAEIDRSGNSPATQQSLLNQIGGTFRMAWNDVGGLVSIPYSQFYNVYSSHNGHTLLETLKNLTFTSYPGGSRNMSFWYGTGTLQSQTLTKTFSVK